MDVSISSAGLELSETDENTRILHQVALQALPHLVTTQ